MGRVAAEAGIFGMPVSFHFVVKHVCSAGKGAETKWPAGGTPQIPWYSPISSSSSSTFSDEESDLEVRRQERESKPRYLSRASRRAISEVNREGRRAAALGRVSSTFSSLQELSAPPRVGI